jgi:hypothetical protein
MSEISEYAGPTDILGHAQTVTLKCTPSSIPGLCEGRETRDRPTIAVMIVLTGERYTNEPESMRAP